MNSAALIREARLRAGLTQRELADRLATTQSVIARWEAGRAHPSAETLSTAVEACGLELRTSLAEADRGDVTLIEHSLALTPERRFEELVRTVAFIRAGREALAKRLG